jgi:hypothetical protein
MCLLYQSDLFPKAMSVTHVAASVHCVLVSSGNHKYFMGLKYSELASMTRNLERGLSNILFSQLCEPDIGGREKCIQNLAAEKKLKGKPRHRLKDNTACTAVAMQRSRDGRDPDSLYFVF